MSKVWWLVGSKSLLLTCSSNKLWAYLIFVTVILVCCIFVRNPNCKNKIWFQDSGNNAIWYDSKSGRWLFGSTKASDGSPKTWIYSEDNVTAPQEATNWKYRRGKLIESDDILVHSLTESGTPAFSKIITALKSQKTCYNLKLN